MLRGIIFIVIFFSSINVFAQRADCDVDLNCVGRAITFSNSSGKGAHYLDVNFTPSQLQLIDKMTVEMWIKPIRQPGKIQFIAGFWGPAHDVNDVWILYINQNDELVFEINGSNTNMQQLDNTIAKTSVADLYDTWYHIAGIFDGTTQTVKLFVNGNLKHFSRNSSFPAFRLRDPQNKELTMKIANTNAFSNDTITNRTFLGQMDEIRIWSRTFTDQEIFCNRHRSLNWGINNLVIYYRCNEEVGRFIICDATNNGNTGFGRSGASIQNSNRPIERTIFMEPVDRGMNFSDTLDCKSPKTYRFRVVDTSSCNKSIIIDIINTDLTSGFVITPNRINNMVKDSFYTFTVTVNADFQGTIAPQLRAYSVDRCRFINRVNMNLTRVTTLKFSNLQLPFDSLKAGCIEKPHIDSVLTIINQTDKTSDPQTVTINSISNILTNVFVLSHQPLPYQLAPGDTFRINVRFIASKFSSNNFDTLRIISNDVCDPDRKIPMNGKVKEVIRVSRGNSEIRLDSINFGSVCVDFPSDAPQYNWMNLLDEDIQVINIEYPPDVQGNIRLFPIQLDPKTGYLPNYFRFIPTKPGLLNDSIVIVVKSGGCTIRRPIYVRGYGLYADIKFDVPEMDFGDVFVGQERIINIPVKNNSSENLRVNFYMKKSDVFFISGTSALNIPGGATRNIAVGFRPTNALSYTDELCFFEDRCYGSGCIKVRGKGIFERFSFSPEVLEINNVIACKDGSGKIQINNRTSITQTLRNFAFINPSGKFTITTPSNLPSQIDLGPSVNIEFDILYEPNDLNNDRSDIAEIRFETNDNEKWLVQIRGSSITPKISAESPVAYGKIEVGENRSRVVTIENISPFVITISSISVPIGFAILDSPDRHNNVILKSRDTLQLTVQFLPTEPKFYSGFMQIQINEPCQKLHSVKLEGEAEIIALEVPLTVLSFGFILPCDCIEREIKLINRSKVFEMIVDSVYFSNIGISSPNDIYFEWTSDFYSANGSILPYFIPANKTDILRVRYCPRDIQNKDSLTHNINLVIDSRGSGWNQQFKVYLTGIQAMLYETNREVVIFPPTRVDTSASPQFARIKFPNYLLNPYRDIVVIDTIMFMPDERVFYAYDSTRFLEGKPSYPITLDTGGISTIQFGFKPRAVRDYESKAVIKLRKYRHGGDCIFSDTTIYLYGSGFAPAFGLSLHFGSNYTKQDTFRVVTCEEILIPIYSSRDFPAEIVDIKMQLNYDTSKIEYIGNQSTYLGGGCFGYLTSISHSQNALGSMMLFKNFCNVDSIRPLAELRFKPKVTTRDTVTFKMDSVAFDTEEVILYHIIAVLDEAIIVILQPEIEIMPEDSFLIMDYDSVRVLDCKDITFSVKNIGDIPINNFDIQELQNYYQVVSYSPPANRDIDVGDSINITIRFCPWNIGTFGSIFKVLATNPCLTSDSAEVTGIGYAPEFNPKFYVNDKYLSPDTIYSKLGDTVNIPIYLDKNFADTIYGVIHVIKALDFELNMLYNPRALKYLNTIYNIAGLKKIDYSHGNLKFSFENINNLSRGKIVESRFLVTVPDFTLSQIRLNSANYNTDSIMFFDIIPLETLFYVNLSDSCGIDSLIFSSTGKSVYPNPAEDMLFISDYAGEFVITDVLGRVLKEGIIDRSGINVGSLPRGFYIMRYGKNTEKIILK